MKFVSYLINDSLYWIEAITGTPGGSRLPLGLQVKYPSGMMYLVLNTINRWSLLQKWKSKMSAGPFRNGLSHRSVCVECHQSAARSCSIDFFRGSLGFLVTGQCTEVEYEETSFQMAEKRSLESMSYCYSGSLFLVWLCHVKVYWFLKLLLSLSCNFTDTFCG